MSTSFRPYFPDQVLLLPPSLTDWLPQGHLAYFVFDTIEALDLTVGGDQNPRKSVEERVRSPDLYTARAT